MTTHSPACDRLLSVWFSEPRESVKYRLSTQMYSQNDFEIRDLLLTIFDEDPVDGEAFASARELWPLLLLSDPPHTPEELSDEIDTLIRDYDLMRLRVTAMAAKFRALEPWSNLWNRFPHEETEHGELNLRWTVRALESFNRMSGDYIREELVEARGYAAKVRVYDNAEAVQR